MMQRLEVARAIAHEVGELLRAAWLQEKVIYFKGEVDLVTDTDREAEARIVAAIQRAFPGDRIVAEEETAKESGSASAEWTWYIDPIDGTTNFAHSYPHFAVSIAAERNGELVLGVVHDPIRRETFSAQRGEGAFLENRRIQVSPVDTLDLALIGTGFPYDRRDRADYYLSFVADVLRRTQGVRRAGTASLDLCYVACGRLDGFFELKLKPWDVAAGALIVEEAGGKATQWSGETLDLYGQQIVASNGRIHRELSLLLEARAAANE